MIEFCLFWAEYCSKVSLLMLFFGNSFQLMNGYFDRVGSVFERYT